MSENDLIVVCTRIRYYYLDHHTPGNPCVVHIADVYPDDVEVILALLRQENGKVISIEEAADGDKALCDEYVEIIKEYKSDPDLNILWSH